MTKKYYTTAETAAIEGISVRRVVAKLKQDQNPNQIKKHYPSAKKYGRDWIIEAKDVKNS